MLSNDQMSLEDIAAVARRWLVDVAAPAWWRLGSDYASGGFVERIGQDGVPITEVRRVRVAARQVHAFALAGQLGWRGPVAEAVGRGLDFLRGPGLGPHGLMAHRIAPGGAVLDAGPDLYDQAFLLLALASARRALGDPVIETEALGVVDRLGALMRHPVAGWEENPARSLPLRANPHMHLLEAAIAWTEVGSDPTWRALGAEVADMARGRFVDPATGALTEYFDAGWGRLSGPEGDSVEPGHLFEWCWLLWRWREAGGADVEATALRFAEIGRTYGVDRERGVAIDELGRNFAPKRRTARLWPQTERLKAGIACRAMAAANAFARSAAEAEIAGAWAAIELYLATAVPGLWYDCMREDGTIVDEPAPASTFYHLAVSIDELVRTVAGDRADPSAQARLARNHS